MIHVNELKTKARHVGITQTQTEEHRPVFDVDPRGPYDEGL